MHSNFIANGYSNLKNEIKKSIIKRYESDLKKEGFWGRLKIKRRIKSEVKMELLRVKKEISHETLF
jgi:hypothetical protein